MLYSVQADRHPSIKEGGTRVVLAAEMPDWKPTVPEAEVEQDTIAIHGHVLQETALWQLWEIALLKRPVRVRHYTLEVHLAHRGGKTTSGEGQTGIRPAGGQRAAPLARLAYREIAVVGTCRKDVEEMGGWAEADVLAMRQGKSLRPGLEIGQTMGDPADDQREDSIGAEDGRPAAEGCGTAQPAPGITIIGDRSSCGRQGDDEGPGIGKTTQRRKVETLDLLLVQPFLIKMYMDQPSCHAKRAQRAIVPFDRTASMVILHSWKKLPSCMKERRLKSRRDWPSPASSHCLRILATMTIR